VKFVKLDNLQMFSGTNPVSLLSARSKSSTFFSPAKLDGKIPVNPLWLASNTVTLPSSPISAGKQPPRSLPIKMTSFKLVILPMLCGMQPVNLLFANVTTETGELPIVSGIVDVNRLSFKNKASRSLLKSSGGKLPSKSLNLMSRYLRLGKVKTTEGKSPTKRLLLTSNSYMSVSLEKLLGMIPQNLLELMWNNATSVKSPNSAGRYPAISAPLRSTPAITLRPESSRAGAQNTPL
jgi:hypothetical protein